MNMYFTANSWHRQGMIGFCLLLCATLSLAQESASAGRHQKKSSATTKASHRSVVHSLQLKNITLLEALTEISERYQAGIALDPTLVPDKRITLTLHSATLDEALEQVLVGTGLQGFVSGNKNIILRKSTSLEITVSGKVTDAESGEPLPGVNVVVREMIR